MSSDENIDEVSADESYHSKSDNELEPLIIIKEEQVEINCPECGQSFTHKKSLNSHLRNVHEIEPVYKNMPQIKCENCSMKFICKASLAKHYKKFHMNNHNYTQRNSRLICPFSPCYESFRRYFYLRTHIQDVHDIELECEQYIFDSMDEFEMWKKEMEERTESLYTLDSAVRPLSDGTKRRYYNCHRSYSYRKQGKDKRTVKSGSNKISKACPSRLEVTILEDELHTTFWKTHCGHTAKIERDPLDKDTKKLIAGKLNKGMSVDSILEALRKKPNSGRYRKLHLLKRKDIYNVIRDYKIGHSSNDHVITPLLRKRTINKELTTKPSDNDEIDFSKWRWLNEPGKWSLNDSEISATTDEKTDFWQNTWYGFYRHTGHVYGCDVVGDFTFQVRLEADFTTLYDQAGLMLLIDEKHWLKAGIEFNDGQSTIGSVLTNGQSDWATGVYPGNPMEFWVRLTMFRGALRLQYSCDGEVWPLLRLCPFPAADKYFVGVMCCTPQRNGLTVKFSDLKISPAIIKDIHDLS